MISVYLFEDGTKVKIVPSENWEPLKSDTNSTIYYAIIFHNNLWLVPKNFRTSPLEKPNKNTKKKCFHGRILEGHFLI